MNENFFLGGWHPTRPLALELTEPPSGFLPVCIQADNWFLLSNTSPLHSHRPGLIHTGQTAVGRYLHAVAFRGYIVEPPIHSYSSSQDILRYWAAPVSLEHNGVFSAACIHNSGHTLELVTDAFGMGPLYYRTSDELVLFATNPKYLTFAGDEPDYMAWRYVLQTGFIAANRSLSIPVKRVPAGDVLRFRHRQVEQHTWFDYAALPDGTRKIDEKAFAAVEDAFQLSLSRCLQLKAQGNVLPLSSGYDSRRILAGLFGRGVPFDALTVRVFQKDHRDLDARFAALMAKDFGFSHTVIEHRDVLEYVHDDCQRRHLMSAESGQHSWAMLLMRSLPEYPTLLFDGLAGDALSESGFDSIPGLHATTETDRRLIASHTITNCFDTILRPAKWPSAREIFDELVTEIASLPLNMNQTELAFLLLHTRRSTALCGQQMLPAGHIVVYPFLDLDYVRTALMFHPAEKLQTPLQQGCLARYWPQFFKYPGNKAIPPGMPPGSPELQNERLLACFRQLQKELSENKGISRVRGLLRKRAGLRFCLALHNDQCALKSIWAFKQLMELVAHEQGQVSCWKIVPESSA